MNRKTNSKNKSVEVEILGNGNYQFQCKHTPADAHLQFENGVWILDVFDSRQPDADTAHIRSIDFPQETRKEHVPFNDAIETLFALDIR